MTRRKHKTARRKKSKWSSKNTSEKPDNGMISGETRQKLAGGKWDGSIISSSTEKGLVVCI